jgi:ligand-binding SRPBCC domain-containing protein
MRNLRLGCKSLKRPRKLKIFHFNSEQWIHRRRRDVFAFFSDPLNLQRITPAWLDFRIAAPGSIEMRPGVRIDYQLKLHGFPLKWQSEITVWDPPFRFVDEQVRGPYKLWRHEHLFEERDGRTLVEDHVEYSVLGGRLVNTLFVARDVNRIFQFRRRKLDEILG